MEKEHALKLLYGTIEATIFNATPPRSTCSFNCALLAKEPTYVSIKLGETKVAETSHEFDRIWYQSFRILCAHPAETTLEFTLRTRLSVLGYIVVPANTHVSDVCLPLLTKKGRCNTGVKIKLSLKFKSAESDSKSCGLVDGATFPPRSNCRVVLYQDAHHRSSYFPPIAVQTGKVYRPRRLWEDVFKAIDGAKHLIYIAGWSLNPKLVLVRDHDVEIPQARGVTLGELLKRKAEEGVEVRIMLWDDETSINILNNQGLMRTHDEDAFNYFKHTKVVCKLRPRLHHKLIPTVFAHHQKTITVDASNDFFENLHEDVNCRHVISFIGGLDLCDGRYDTEEHSLFRTLNLESHCGDFYQTSIHGAGLNRGGPREPWHDAHACVIGEAACDVLTNFKQCWEKQCEPNSLLNSIKQLQCFSHPNTSSNWNVQVFRSIDKSSVKMQNHQSLVEHSIHDAYVQAIRGAKRFIYIENQYFIGGCHLWSKDQHSGCKNLIPLEVALKVANKIKAGDQFAVYIVIPMWPEGVPESETVQDILHWTRLTMDMMYRVIGQAIRESGVEAHPRDYLNFFCLANREIESCEEFVPPCSPPQSTNYSKSQKNRRFMIYVHSKLMIVDDEYILIGSANANQRSMDGERDTEIAIGCYQQNFSDERSRNGDVHDFRMSLWYEHCAQIEDIFLQPESIECVKRFQKIGEEMWKVYSGDEVIDMGGKHLVNYPINVSEKGVVEDLVEINGTFPDTRALIRGKRSRTLPPICTT
ncbi:hypothetical protein J5N97_007933 [Dioscorea zingiberensis]|uniref:Phospholipase D n=1 Tax=Dioscorea zingiberensis TaxID=325984 RepID=A0A9D5DGI2_9LILI|nr:hypothetical protein J5N97_007933 [Dioscorea zingiberensis]